MLHALRTRLDSWAVIGLFGAAYLASQIAISITVHALGSEMLLAQVLLSAERVRALFEGWQARGLLDTYAAHYRYDTVHPLWYSVALAAMLAKALTRARAPGALDRWLLVPFVAGALDVLENTVHQRFVADLGAITQANVFLANGAACLKWALVAAALGMLARLSLGAKYARIEA